MPCLIVFFSTGRNFGLWERRLDYYRRTDQILLTHAEPKPAAPMMIDWSKSGGKYMPQKALRNYKIRPSKILTTHTTS